MARLLKEQRLRISTLKNKQKEKVFQLQLEHQERLQEYKHLISQAQRDLAERDKLNDQLKETIKGQSAKIEGIREYFEHKITLSQMGEKNQLQILQENYEMEIQAKVEAATTEFKQMLHMREMELKYRNEQENSLREEIVRLRQENKNLLNNNNYITI